jgi:hypothetical protein
LVSESYPALWQSGAGDAYCFDVSERSQWYAVVTTDGSILHAGIHLDYELSSDACGDRVYDIYSSGIGGDDPDGGDDTEIPQNVRTALAMVLYFSFLFSVAACRIAVQKKRKARREQQKREDRELQPNRTPAASAPRVGPRATLEKNLHAPQPTKYVVSAPIVPSAPVFSSPDYAMLSPSVYAPEPAAGHDETSLPGSIPGLAYDVSFQPYAYTPSVSSPPSLSYNPEFGL